MFSYFRAHVTLLMILREYVHLNSLKYLKIKENSRYLTSNVVDISVDYKLIFNLKAIIITENVLLMSEIFLSRSCLFQVDSAMSLTIGTKSHVLEALTLHCAASQNKS